METLAQGVQGNAYALYLAARDPHVPLFAKAVVVIVLAYAVSPIDLIPDFIPVLGYVDDLILLPLGIALAIRLLPRKVRTECQARAQTHLQAALPRSRRAMGVIVGIWLLALALIGVALWRGLAAG